jgi:hypothetical protein
VLGAVLGAHLLPEPGLAGREAVLVDHSATPAVRVPPGPDVVEVGGGPVVGLWCRWALGRGTHRSGWRGTGRT